MARPPPNTTRGLWEFTEYFLDQRGSRNIPQKFLKSAQWEEEHRSVPGYFAGEGSLIIAVEFNFEHLCWTEARYRRTERQWHIHKITGSDLGLTIHLDELTPDKILQVTGDSDSSTTPLTLTGQQICERVEETVMLQTTDSFEETENRMSEGQLEYFGEPINQFPEPDVLTNEDHREMVDHFANPEEARVRATETTTTICLQPNLWANVQPSTIQRAAGENPPQDNRGGGRGGNGGGGRGHDGGGSGGGGGGHDGGGGGGGSGGGGNPPATGGPPPGHPGGGGGENRLFGQPPDIFTGDRSKTKEFLTQWELYYNLNHLTNVMGVPYSRCMLFLTFCKGPLLATWASTMAQDISNHARQPGVGVRDERLWTHLADSFHRQYTDTLEREWAEDVLQRGIKMKGENLDDYVTKYEALTLEAGYRRDDPLCLRKFTDGLPHNLYKDCMCLDRPGNYKQWKASAIRRQGEYIHFKNRREQVKGVPPRLYNPFAPRQNPHTAQRDPNAMDVDWGRAHLADAEDVLYNDAYKREVEQRSREEDRQLGIDKMPKPPFKPREGYHQHQQEMRKGGLAKVKCYNCNQMGHISRYCPQKRKAKARATQEEPAEQTPSERANMWLRGVGGESDEVKNLILQTMWREEDFPSA